MLPRFLVPDLDPSLAEATVKGGEAHHLTRVLRLGPGDAVAIFDGRGREFRAQVDRVAGSTVVVRLVEPMPSAHERRVSLTLAQSILKGSSMDDVVRDATMMGVTAVVPLITAHTVARRAASPHGAERWKRVAVASAKQCRRATVPEIADPVTFELWLSRPPEGTGLLLIEPSAHRAEARPIRALGALAPPASATLAVGPEGGWTGSEIEAALAAGHTAVTLGQLTLRAEAVPLAALAALTVIWD
jgi:16S rRNA (uracil1498-N3)-methyltransferase